jgi:hypothetical protein
MPRSGLVRGVHGFAEGSARGAGRRTEMSKERRQSNEEYWCGCEAWREQWRFLANFEAMRFCLFCGKRLLKPEPKGRKP